MKDEKKTNVMGKQYTLEQLLKTTAITVGYKRVNIYIYIYTYTHIYTYI